ncbi:acyl-CoA dehydrogenase family protein [Polyangium aurulentum]|uniref:acyl-CoA dehydrogenase family protein n=1 Tax=Polyangium aurulentum TaxID=2567896 RepID=UPI0010AE6CD8|nr:acyl-CoA dehydrogenase family protein [Polyangium aurulentum]UQA55014.1 acyl-CoA dehydrogenase family protein [Polyangium aurulentum]
MSGRISIPTSELGPFFEPRHDELAQRLSGGLLDALAGKEDAAEVGRILGKLDLYAHLVPEAYGGAASGRPKDLSFVDVRALVLVREALGQVSPLADSIFAVQGLGTYPIVLGGSQDLVAEVVPDVVRGLKIGAFALTEPEAGSDVASLQTRAQKDGDDWVLDGEKTLISNVGIADHYVVFANADPSLGRKGISAFYVPKDTPGLTLERLPMSVPHPLGRLRLAGCRVPGANLVGHVGGGFRLAMETLDAFRISVGAAANGMAERALSETITRVKKRRQFGAPLADQQMVKAYLAEMATELDASRLLVARAAHRRDTTGERVTALAAMAKMHATEAAQRVIDKAVQLHGGMGVVEGTEVERLYREIRPLRIYEGTTEIQKLVIARELLTRDRGES